MFKTKTRHKWDGAAFIREPYIDPARIKAPDRLKGKQFQTNPIKKGNAALKGVLFSNHPGDGGKLRARTRERESSRSIDWRADCRGGASSKGHSY